MPARLVPRMLSPSLVQHHHARHRRRRAGARQGDRPATSGDRFLLCSDGLFKTLGEDQLSRILGTHGEILA